MCQAEPPGPAKHRMGLHRGDERAHIAGYLHSGNGDRPQHRFGDRSPQAAPSRAFQESDGGGPYNPHVMPAAGGRCPLAPRDREGPAHGNGVQLGRTPQPRISAKALAHRPSRPKTQTRWLDGLVGFSPMSVHGSLLDCTHHLHVDLKVHQISTARNETASSPTTEVRQARRPIGEGEWRRGRHRTHRSARQRRRTRCLPHGADEQRSPSKLS
jgi:hypothetical protein